MHGPPRSRVSPQVARDRPTIGSVVCSRGRNPRSRDWQCELPSRRAARRVRLATCRRRRCCWRSPCSSWRFPHSQPTMLTVDQESPDSGEDTAIWPLHTDVVGRRRRAASTRWRAGAMRCLRVTRSCWAATLAVFVVALLALAASAARRRRRALRPRLRRPCPYRRPRSPTTLRRRYLRPRSPASSSSRRLSRPQPSKEVTSTSSTPTAAASGG